MTTDEAPRRLAELPGIGPWSAGLVLLRGLGRTDVFPPAMRSRAYIFPDAGLVNLNPFR